jgi:hypothetical protein
MHHGDSIYQQLEHFLDAMSSDDLEIIYEAGPFNP